MGILNRIVNSVKSFVNDDFLNAITSACALVSYADGQASEEEKEKMLQYMKINPTLKVFKMSKVEETFEKYTQNIAFDVNVGRLECYKAIEKIKEEREDCKRLVACCIAIAKSDGFIDKAELQTIEKICDILRVNFSEFEM